MMPETHPTTENEEITRMLNGSDEVGSDTDLVATVYTQLRQIAQKRMSKERSDHTLQATALVHEAYIKMADQIENREWKNRA